MENSAKHKVNTQFVLGAYDQAIKKNQTNIAISPYSCFIALSILANTSKSDTFKPLLYDDSTLAEFNEQNKKLTAILLESKDINIETANSVWIDSKVEKTDINMINDLTKYYNAECFNENLIESVDKINTWASEKTHKKINSIVDNFESDVMAVLINALYFKGKWQKEFDNEVWHTNDYVFNNYDGTQSKPQYMHSNDYGCQYFKMNDIDAVSLNYGYSADFSMILFRGKDTKVLIKNALEWDYESTLIKKELQINLSIPKFKIEAEVNDVFKTMGLSKYGDFLRLGYKNGEPAKIEKAIQKVFIEVNEKGTEATAVTALQCESFGIEPPKEETINFVLNNPFVYIIRHNKTGTILFAGVQRKFD